MVEGLGEVMEGELCGGEGEGKIEQELIEWLFSTPKMTTSPHLSLFSSSSSLWSVSVMYLLLSFLLILSKTLSSSSPSSSRCATLSFFSPPPSISLLSFFIYLIHHVLFLFLSLLTPLHFLLSYTHSLPLTSSSFSTLFTSLLHPSSLPPLFSPTNPCETPIFINTFAILFLLSLLFLLAPLLSSTLLPLPSPSPPLLLPLSFVWKWYLLAVHHPSSSSLFFLPLLDSLYLSLFHLFSLLPPLLSFCGPLSSSFPRTIWKGMVMVGVVGVVGVVGYVVGGGWERESECMSFPLVVYLCFFEIFRLYSTFGM